MKQTPIKLISAFTASDATQLKREETEVETSSETNPAVIACLPWFVSIHLGPGTTVDVVQKIQDKIVIIQSGLSVDAIRALGKDVRVKISKDLSIEQVAAIPGHVRSVICLWTWNRELDALIPFIRAAKVTDMQGNICRDAISKKVNSSRLFSYGLSVNSLVQDLNSHGVGATGESDNSKKRRLSNTNYRYGMRGLNILFTVGDCFFDAIKHNLENSQFNSADILRNIMANEMQKNEHLYKGSILDKGIIRTPAGDVPYAGWSQYLEIISDPTRHAYVDQIEISALSNALNRPIVVLHDLNRPADRPLSDIFQGRQYSHVGEPLFVGYNGIDHYVPLVPPANKSVADILPLLMQDFPGEDQTNVFIPRAPSA